MLDVALLAEQPFELLILLVFGHFLADFPLQSDRMAVEKCPGKDAVLDWRWWLAAHSATHGLVVSLLTGVPFVGLAEMIFHAAIDYGKCRFRYSLAADQLMHVVCKVVWVLVLTKWL
nr:DUF3307 domain-containing protein [Synechococcus sp. NOUM97013]